MNIQNLQHPLNQLGEFIKKKHKVISINIETNKRFDNPKVGDLMDTNFKMLSILACVILN